MMRSTCCEIVTGVLERRAGSNFEIDDELTAVRRFDEFGSDKTERGKGPEKQQKKTAMPKTFFCSAGCSEAVRGTPTSHRKPRSNSVAIHPAGCARTAVQFRKSGGEHRREREGDKQAHQGRDHNDDREFRMMSPTRPTTNVRGTNTTTSTRVMESAAKPISLRPFSAASRGGSFRSR